MKKPFYKKWWFIAIVALLLLAGIGSSLGESEQDDNVAATEKKTEEVAKVAAETTVDESEVLANIENMTGGGFVKSTTFTDNKVTIDFYESYDAYKADNAQSKVTQEQYKTYFETGDAIKKILVVESVRLLRKTPALESVQATLPYEGKTHSIKIDRGELTDYLGFDVSELVENADWSDKFVNPIGYDDAKRNDFFVKFGNE